MRVRNLTAFLTPTLLLLGLAWLTTDPALAAPAAKVKVCHVPPDDPSNFHTITISEKALDAHLGHSDLAGSCFASAEALCDDGNACTIDEMDEATETCFSDHPPVDCNDGLLCTDDSCDPFAGCQAAPVVCDDDDNCTIDACNPMNGQCTGSPIDCGSLGLCLAETGQCDFPCDGITCNPIDQCHAVGECVLPGECVDGAQLADGTPCDDGDAGTEDDQCTGGVCAGTAASCVPAVAAIGVSPQGGGEGVPGADDFLACRVDNILVTDGAVAGLDYINSGFNVFGGLGKLPGDTSGDGSGTFVAGCVAADFGRLIPSGPVSIRAGRIKFACGRGCTSCFSPLNLLVYFGSTLDSFELLAGPIVPASITLIDFTFNVPENFRYFTVCRTAHGAGAADIMVDAIVVGALECLE